MSRYTLICLVLFSTLVPITALAAQETAPNATYDLLYNCYQLECLWHALYGPNHPLVKHIETYKAGINEYIKRHSPNYRTVPGNSLQAPEDQEQLFAIKKYAGELLDQYKLTTTEITQSDAPLTIPGPSSYSATALPGISASEQDTVLQQVFAAIQQLQAQKQAHSVENNNATLKEQLTLFTIGIVLLGCATYITHRPFSKHIKKLRKKTEAMRQEMTAFHSDTKKCGIQAHLDCTLQQFNKGGK